MGRRYRGVMLDNPWVVVPLLIVLYLTVYTFVKRVDGDKWRLVWVIWIIVIVMLLTIRLVQSL
ncbi:hypothetical protein EVJ33_07410 [Exiguobacterium sp. SL-10]|uniref:hypothetical protein n=1 Tax=Exiguobacterium sp. SL-10 TaxID=2510962 RepID=UPI001038B0DC|nr:hypothetical protein [Exiguobacterium sp. SL-10]TCI29960.1 hypothetical protein EVJ33_07410 [Exiguobacterium sp. SL-10]